MRHLINADRLFRAALAFGWFWLLCAVFHCSLARADDAALARAAFEQGVSASEAGAWHEARSGFAQSQALAPKASTLFNLAFSELKLGLYREALSSLAALDALADPATHSALLDRAQALRLEAEAAATRARLNALELSLRTAPPATAETPTAPTTEAARPTRIGRSLTGAGASLAVAAAGAGIWWHNRSQNLEACHRPEHVTCHEANQIAQQNRSATALTLALGTAALGLVTTGAIWLGTRGKRSQARAALRTRGPIVVFAF